MKKILGMYSAPAPHWVGNGFPVRSPVFLRKPRQATEPLPAAGLRRTGTLPPLPPSLAALVSTHIAALKQ